MDGFFLAAKFLLLLSFSIDVHGEFAAKGCDIFKGIWVYDNSYPLYDARKCPFCWESIYTCIAKN